MAIDHQLLDQLKLTGRTGAESLGAWFLGVKGENQNLFEELIVNAIRNHVADRKTDYPNDPVWITEKVKNNQHYKEGVEILREEFRKLMKMLEYSVPFYSYRYQGHMLWDVTLPSLLGYFSAMLYNQNNVAAEASPVTTFLEMEVGDDLCRMLGYYVPDRKYDDCQGIIYDQPKEDKRPGAWGHITCDGSVANLESMWAARNLKYYPLAVAQAISFDPALKAAQELTVDLPTGKNKRLIELTGWELFNLKVDDILALPRRIQDEYGIAEDALGAIEKYTVQAMGFAELHQRYPDVASEKLVIFSPSTSHYSWPKSAALLGIGHDNVKTVHVDLDGRMDINHLCQHLDKCLADHQPVAMVVGVLGTTEESAVDPIADIVDLRNKFRQRGLEFFLHIDAAWGGYFASMLRKPSDKTMAAAINTAEEKSHGSSTQFDSSLRVFTPYVAMSDYVSKQYDAIKEADSITVDPHKAGYIPYPAGGLCYRNSALRNLVSFTAPVVYHGGIDPTVGVYGVEGSKPGAAAAATYLSHRVIRTDQSGYGRILGRCMFNSKRLYAALITMAKDDDDFILVPFQRLPAEKSGYSEAAIERQRRHIADFFVTPDNDQLWEHLQKHREDLDLFREMGSDQIIISYTLNFKENGRLNCNVDRMNAFNDAIFKRLSIREYQHCRIKRMEGCDDGSGQEVPFIITASSFDPANYGTELVTHYMQRLGVHPEPDKPVKFLISTTMDPWLTDTAEGNFIPSLISAFRAEIETVLNEFTS